MRYKSIDNTMQADNIDQMVPLRWSDGTAQSGYVVPLVAAYGTDT